MTKTDDYRQRLANLKDWTPFLMKESGLPGPRGNLELAAVVAEQASREQIEAFLAIPADRAPENSPQVFLVFCGLCALGKRAARGEVKELMRLRTYASDARWRVREAVAIGLQYYGDANPRALLRELRPWVKGNWYEKRAAAAALCEPRLLADPEIASEVLKILDNITTDIERTPGDKSEAFKTLRKSMGYCWSVAVAALPKAGKPMLAKWLERKSPDVRWIVKENLAKNRLSRLDPVWVKACLARLAGRA